MIYATDFGQFISEQKHKHSLQSKELAEMIDITWDISASLNMEIEYAQIRNY